MSLRIDYALRSVRCLSKHFLDLALTQFAPIFETGSERIAEKLRQPPAVPHKVETAVSLLSTFWLMLGPRACGH